MLIIGRWLSNVWVKVSNNGVLRRINVWDWDSLMGWQTSIAPTKSSDYSCFLQLTSSNYTDVWIILWKCSNIFTNVTNYATVNCYDQVPWKKQIYDDFGVRSTVYPRKYAHGFCFAVLCCGYTLTDFPISIRLTSLALWQSNDCPSASKTTLMNMDKYFMWIHYERLHNHNKAKHNKTVCMFLGI